MSEPWAINAGKASTAIGTATIESDDNLLTITDHGLGDGDTVMVDTLTGGGSALTADAVYFVRDVDGNDFALSLSLHGPQVEFATDGGADVYHFAPQYNAAQLRRLNAVLMFGGTSDAFGVRQGVRPGHVPLSVSGTTWTVEDLTGAVYPGLSSDDGGYPVAHQSESGSLDPADGSNDRIDALDLQIQDDDEDASGFRRARVVYVDGTPAADPDPPTVTTNALRLGTILVPAGGSPSPSVATLAQWTVAAGGVLPVRDESEGPSSGRYHGMVRYRQDSDTLDVYDGSDWQHMSSPGGWHAIQAGEANNVASFDVDLTDGGRFPAGTFSTWKMRINGRGDGTTEVWVRVNDISTSTYLYIENILEAQTDTVDGNSSLASDRWRIADWGTAGGLFNPLEFTLSVVSAGIVAQWQSTDLSSNRRSAYGGGRHDGSVIPTKLTVLIGTGSATEFVRARWEIEGYITPDFTVPSPS